MTQEHRLIAALNQVKHELLIPAAEYVPAIPACWEIIDAALAASTPVGGWVQNVPAAPDTASSDTQPGDLREKVALEIRNWPFDISHIQGCLELADAILDLIQSERAG